ncbi:hypothetical protein EMPG_15793 [Blastomyces silverae]|uniref:Uncharacterized protein n=1 Tax=Blastomyces silverae TaxID=2060906 RepID=A0A0H1BCC4_9EURO|nr:hypothetical protein EMPG_15793 [Blastomyces silverae]
MENARLILLEAGALGRPKYLLKRNPQPLPAFTLAPAIALANSISPPALSPHNLARPHHAAP